METCVPLSPPVARTTSSISRIVASNSLVASGWKTIAALPSGLDFVLRLQADVRGRDREQPVRRRAVHLVATCEDVAQSHAGLRPRYAVP